jgi:hypothetical protein
VEQLRPKGQLELGRWSQGRREKPEVPNGQRGSGLRWPKSFRRRRSLMRHQRGPQRSQRTSAKPPISKTTKAIERALK